MTYLEVIPAGRTSITDRDDWRRFCRRATADLTLIRDGEPVLERTIEGVSYAEARYERIASRLQRLFGSWAGWHIVEVGGGYGGQARVLLDRHPCTYWIHDLPEPAELQHAYLAAHGHHLADLGAGDLFLSNYAISEGSRDMQEAFLRVAAECPRGYITWNGWTHDAYTRREFAAQIPGSKWIRELSHPHANPRNGCLVWGTR